MRRGDTRRTFAAVVALLSVVVVASACLGPTDFDPTGRAPIGNLEVVQDASGGIRVAGWALDPETSASIPVRVAVRGDIRDVTANLPRGDVAATFPRLGAAHGFDYTYGPLAPDLYDICVWVENTVGTGDDRLLGCRKVTVTARPLGNFESLVATPGRARAVGWAFDPKSPSRAEVVVTVDGALVKRLRTDVVRSNVAAARGRVSAVGFDVEFPARTGRRQVCVAVFDIRSGAKVSLGCRTVTVPAPVASRAPSGKLTSVVPVGTDRIDVTGVATDPDGAVPQVTVTVDGGAGGTQVVPVGAGSFSASFTGLSQGAHEVCARAADVVGPSGPAGTTVFTCGSFVLGDIGVGTTGTPSAPTGVGPPAGNALGSMERDAGISTVLRDGSVLWIFGDSLAVDADGNLRYFVNNTAAWAAPGSPAVTRDAVSGGQPVLFAAPPAMSCPPHAPRPALWPLSAVTLPNGPTDRVIAFMAKVCLGMALTIVPQGVAAVEWNYDPAAPPVDAPVRGVVRNAALFDAAAPYGTGSHLGPDGYAYAYQCSTPSGAAGPDGYGPCTVGRVPAASLTVRSAWRFWDGADWVAPIGAATPMQLPAGTAGTEAPVADFTVDHDAVHGVYVMAYSPWPGFTDRVYVRVATSPQGPWTPPVTVHLPGCGESFDGVGYYCYAGTAQPKFSSPGLIGLGYYDQLVSVGPTKGQYVVVTVPFQVVLQPAP